MTCPCTCHDTKVGQESRGILDYAAKKEMYCGQMVELLQKSYFCIHDDFFLNLILFLLQRKMYIKNAKVFPLVKWTKWKPNSHMYRKVIGGSEVVCGAILSFIPGKYPSIIMFFNH